MPLPRLLPSDLPIRFSVAQAADVGVSPERLRRTDLRSPFHGVRSAVETDDTLLTRCLEFAPRLKPWQFFSHETALALLGVPMPEWPYRPALHVSAHRPAREPRVVGVVGHRLQTRESAATNGPHAIRIENAARAWRQTGALWRLDDLIAAGDYLVFGDAPLSSVSELSAEVATMGDTRRRLLSTALLHVRPGVRSPRETRLRLLLIRAGLPEPETGWILRDSEGGKVAELDLAFPRWRVASEYDGRVHAEDAAQFAKDADRWDRIRAQGWEHVRILNHHMRGSGWVAVEKVRSALLAAGWRGPSA